MYFFRPRTYFPHRGCLYRRSTITVTLFIIELLTTTPLSGFTIATGPPRSAEASSRRRGDESARRKKRAEGPGDAGPRRDLITGSFQLPGTSSAAPGRTATVVNFSRT